jgi:AbrB family looped-hinge helix DNA binding protein
MTTATITSKGQVTIPAPVRTALGLGAGDRIDFIETEKGQFAIVAATHSVQRLKGLIAKPPQAISIEEMNAAIAARGASAQ